MFSPEQKNIIAGKGKPVHIPSRYRQFQISRFYQRRVQRPLDELPLEELLLAEAPVEAERPLADLIFPASSSGGAILSISSPGMVLTQSLP